MAEMKNCADNPEPVEDIHGDGRWMSQHLRFIAEGKEREPDVLFIGDSIIQQMRFSKVWKMLLEPLHCLNFGIGGDQTQNVLWRVSNQELDNVSPDVIVLMVGTNNHGHNAEQIVDGIMAIAEVVRTKQPKAQLIIMGILPRGQNPNPLRIKNSKVNSLLEAKLRCRENATFFAVDDEVFVGSDGSISASDMYDYLHLTPEGYTKLCEPLLGVVEDLLQIFVKVENVSLDTDSMAGELASDTQ
ncbi:platelet-activating factor acetylhydrolase IB subunit beta-like [Mizuhopecten yessoensis]|uniref:Platelet-activating factor acetylhydrolase IB subunit gamma n=1 Tax=Mizuhopecten yessoensis TaxID=6573 RepID=A0A210PT28_MIZYE|nr:platelet-activating factor acetylhydrolase IB subunit beta-like [Mizuhopecten yessoensis]OWF39606.1 Platelet-activating factor acetylhydrolase IB subunit gamma [Mizuhopecten yessoensis]